MTAETEPSDLNVIILYISKAIPAGSFIRKEKTIGSAICISLRAMRIVAIIAGETATAWNIAISIGYTMSASFIRID